MADPNSPRRSIIGMDFDAPYGVYVDGERIAEHETEAQAVAHHNRLAGLPRDPKPTPAAGEI